MPWLVLRGSIPCSRILYYIILYYIILYCIILCYIILYYIILYYIILYYIILLIIIILYYIYIYVYIWIDRYYISHPHWLWLVFNCPYFWITPSSIWGICRPCPQSICGPWTRASQPCTTCLHSLRPSRCHCRRRPGSFFGGLYISSIFWARVRILDAPGYFHEIPWLAHMFGV